MVKNKKHSKMKKNMIIGFFILSLGWILTGCERQQEFATADDLVASVAASIEEISPEQLKTKLDEGEMILLIDVREKSEHNPGYIPSAINICRGVLEFKMGNEKFWDDQFLYLPEKSDEIIVYCKKGKRGVLAASALKSLGYTNVKNLTGGWKQWEMTYPLEHEKNLEEMGHGPVEEEGGC